MIREYKRKITSVVCNMLMAFAAAAFIFVIVRAISGRMLISIVIALIILAVSSAFIFSDANLKIVVDDTKVTFIEKKKTTAHIIADCSFSSIIRDGTDFELTVIDGGETFHYDCSYIGSDQYKSLLDDLGVTGEKQAVRKLETRKGE